MSHLIRRTLPILTLCAALTSCGSDSSSPGADIGTAGASTTVDASPPVDSAEYIAVAGPLHVGDSFEVVFSGPLRESRGGYLWLQRPDDTRVALLRGDGNPEIPMGYELDVDRAAMLDDGLSGDTSAFVLPPQIPPGPYRLCTANSAVETCVGIDVGAP